MKKPRSLKVTLPLPTKPLSPNWRGHWAVKANAVARARTNATHAALNSGWNVFWEPMRQATVHPVFFFKTNRRRDGSNAAASLKSYEDGLQDARVIANDSGFIWHPPKLLVDAKSPRVELWITEVLA